MGRSEGAYTNSAASTVADICKLYYYAQVMWNRVVTIEDFWDRPRSGIAFHDGDLVAYKSLWDIDADDYSDQYGIAPIDENLLPLIEERLSIFIRWSNAFHAGETPRETHPALPADRSRYDELTSILDPHIKVDPENCKRLCAEFKSVQPGWNGAVVRWFHTP